MAHGNGDWIFVCDNCGREWPTVHEHHVREHERTHGHQVYQQHKETYMERKRQHSGMGRR